MMEEIPFTLVFDDAVVCGPANDGSKDHALEGEGAVGIIANGVAQQMAVAGGIGEIVLAIVFVDPRSLEEAVRIISLEGLSLLVDNHDRPRLLGKLHHVLAQTHAAARQSGFVALG